MLLSRLLRPLIRLGRLTVIDADGRSHVFGTDSEPSVTVRLHDRSLHWRLALNPGLHAGEAYMAGTLTVEDASPYEFIELFARNMERVGAVDLGGPVDILNRSLRRLKQFNPAPRARRNVAHHYDLSSELYDLFLDADRQYSCAYFTEPGQDLETAQLRKKQHIAAKLRLEPGMKVLDIGCGWGGLGLYLAQRLGAEVTGITLSTEQLAIANARAAAAELDASARFHLRDYRHETGKFDRIVSVGMFEHVGSGDYSTYFARIAELLRKDGVALIHSIGRLDGPCATNPFVAKWIFPGGALPALSEVTAAVEKSGLIMTDIEILRLHYAETLRQWRRRFLQHAADAERIAGPAFVRMWEFYLAGCEAAFRHQYLMVFQLQMAKRIDTVPLTRDYMVEAERRLAQGATPALRPLGVVPFKREHKG